MRSGTVSSLTDDCSNYHGRVALQLAAADLSTCRFFYVQRFKGTSMFRNTTIRVALLITIVAYSAALMLVFVTSITGLMTANTALYKMYSVKTAAMSLLPARP